MKNIASLLILTILFSGTVLAQKTSPPCQSNKDVSDQDSILITGAVRCPGRITVSKDLTIRQAIISAGGVLRNAAKRKVRLIRKASDNSPKIVYVDLLKSGNNSIDVVLKAGDVIQVPHASSRK
jgi:protein involved in polysaccharide export with SLBB domain